MIIYSNVIHSQNDTASTGRSVMIIPFDPNMYFSDADEQLSKYNDKSVKEIRTLFRYGLNVNVNAKILSHYQTRPLLTDTAKTAMDDLYAIYRGISYFKDRSMPLTEAEERTWASEERKKSFSFKKKEDDSDAHTASSLKEPVTRHEYMNVKIHDSRMLPYLKNKYGTDVFVFINQFDLVTNYEHCLDRATNTFERDIKVHFSILDYTGKQLAGDIAIVHFPSNTNDITEIMRNNFPIIADYLAGKLTRDLTPVKDIPVKTNSTVKEDQMEFEEGKE
jgi:hypothetical protein